MPRTGARHPGMHDHRLRSGGGEASRILIGCVAFLCVALAVGYGVMRRRPPGDHLPASLDEFRRQPGGEATVDAGEFLIALAKSGQLPGFKAGEHGSMAAPNLAPLDKEHGAYPISRVVVFHKEGDDSEYHHIVEHESKGGAWKLRAAWRADESGRTVEEYPVPR
jgi:hypothetical protein